MIGQRYPGIAGMPEDEYPLKKRMHGEHAPLDPPELSEREETEGSHMTTAQGKPGHPSGQR